MSFFILIPDLSSFNSKKGNTFSIFTTSLAMVWASKSSIKSLEVELSAKYGKIEFNLKSLFTEQSWRKLVERSRKVAKSTEEF